MFFHVTRIRPVASATDRHTFSSGTKMSLPNFIYFVISLSMLVNSMFSTQFVRSKFYVFLCRNSFYGPGPPHYRGFTITLSYTRHARLESSGRVINPTQKPLPIDTHHSKNTDIHAPDGIRNPRKRATADPSLRPRGHWNQPSNYVPYHYC